MIQIYHHPLSAFCRRIKIFALEKNLELDWQTVALEKKANQSPEYLALNPYGVVPCLKENDFVLYESMAILQYLEERYPSPSLLPNDAQGRARVLMHMKLCDVEFQRRWETFYMLNAFCRRNSGTMKQ